MLETNQTITSLWVEGKELGDESAGVIGKVLGSSMVLKNLIFKYEIVGDAAALEIAKFLEVSKSIRNAQVRFQFIEAEAASILARAFESNKVIENYKIYHWQVSPKGAETLANVIHHHPDHIQSLTWGNATTSPEVGIEVVTKWLSMKSSKRPNSFGLKMRK